MSITVSVPCPTCSGCARPAWSESPAPRWAALAGTARVEWADGTPCSLPLDSRELFPRAESLPLPGEERVVRVHGPFLADGRVPFWALFEPALAALNGLDEYPELMRNCALIACTPRAVIARGGGYAWLRVRVEEVTKLVEAADRFPPSAVGSLEGLLPPGGARMTSSQVASGGLLYYCWSIQSNIGCWAVCTDDEHGMAVLLYGEWAFDQDDVALGHRPLSPSETAQLRAAWPDPRPGRNG
ncbi:hypothetical protein NRF20_02225 [Streptomyces sp. R-74717]|uniref:hypothetical protein n=2 Tax=unclassified Streptomyces TaxID=2593676 RepID=UPI0039B49BD2